MVRNEEVAKQIKISRKKIRKIGKQINQNKTNKQNENVKIFKI